MNRYGAAKQRLAIRTICDHLDVGSIHGTCLPILRIQDLLRERMPVLPYVVFLGNKRFLIIGCSKEVIDSAIGYLEVGATVAIDCSFP